MAVDAGADAVGFVVDAPRSPRNLSVVEARRLIENAPVFVETVVVTVPRHLTHLKEIINEFDGSTIQVHGLSRLHGDMQKELPHARLIPSMQATPNFDIAAAVEVAKAFKAVHFDSYAADNYGGTGMENDWEVARRVREAIHPNPLILAGGLTTANVKQMVRVVKPFAVDVSSGVESAPGVKDRDKVYEFVRNAKVVET
jgi:phosphoribosylanthranilate isomerase